MRRASLALFGVIALATISVSFGSFAQDEKKIPDRDELMEVEKWLDTHASPSSGDERRQQTLFAIRALIAQPPFYGELEPCPRRFDSPQHTLGLSIREADGVVSWIDLDGPAYRAGLRLDDYILSIDHETVLAIVAKGLMKERLSPHEPQAIELVFSDPRGIVRSATVVPQRIAETPLSARIEVREEPDLTYICPRVLASDEHVDSLVTSIHDSLRKTIVLDLRQPLAAPIHAVLRIASHLAAPGALVGKLNRVDGGETRLLTTYATERRIGGKRLIVLVSNHTRGPIELLIPFLARNANFTSIGTSTAGVMWIMESHELKSGWTIKYARWRLTDCNDEFHGGTGYRPSVVVNVTTRETYPSVAIEKDSAFVTARRRIGRWY